MHIKNEWDLANKAFYNGNIESSDYLSTTTWCQEIINKNIPLCIFPALSSYALEHLYARINIHKLVLEIDKIITYSTMLHEEAIKLTTIKGMITQLDTIIFRNTLKYMKSAVDNVRVAINNDNMRVNKYNSKNNETLKSLIMSNIINYNDSNLLDVIDDLYDIWKDISDNRININTTNIVYDNKTKLSTTENNLVIFNRGIEEVLDDINDEIISFNIASTIKSPAMVFVQDSIIYDDGEGK